MKSFLLKNNIPVISWGSLPNETFFEGDVPEGYSLAVCPSENIVILDVDNKNGKCGWENIPHLIRIELDATFNYFTKSGGAHFWIKYTGNKTLKNTSTKYGLDLRIGAKKNNAGGYVKYHHDIDIRKQTHLIREASLQMNLFLEKLFS